MTDHKKAQNTALWGMRVSARRSSIEKSAVGGNHSETQLSSQMNRTIAESACSSADTNSNMLEQDSEELCRKLAELGLTRQEYAVRLKDQGNTFFKRGEYEQAIEYYSTSIKCFPTAAVYGNRSTASLKREMFGSAQIDAEEAIKLDPNYTKGYYRRGTAFMALGKYKLALKDFSHVVKTHPNDPDAKKFLGECRTIIKRQAFEEAIACNDHRVTAVEEATGIYEASVVEDDYEGPRFDGEITLDFVKELIAHLKNQGKLHKKYAIKLLLQVYELNKKLDSLIDIEIADKQRFTVCGDVHGQFYDLCNIFEINGMPSESNPYLFNGDFVDRGSFSVETILTLFSFRLLYPNSFFLARGNHEADSLNTMYGFATEVKQKYSESMMKLFSEVFCVLPLVHVISSQHGKVFVCHGGVPSDPTTKLEDIKKIWRDRQPPEDGVMCHLLWSDPHAGPGVAPSKRGVGCQFGYDVTDAFCENNGISYVVRSHEVKMNGYERNHKRCYTVFSAPNYCDNVGNQGAFMTVTGATINEPKFTSFDAVGHPDVPAMRYLHPLLQ